MNERWKMLPQSPNHEVSDCGSIRSITRFVKRSDGIIQTFYGKILRQETSSTGYPTVRFCVNGLLKKYLVHRLVAEAFVLNSKNKPWVNHIDGNKKNPHYTNLEWCTPRENVDHAVKIGLVKYGDSAGSSKISLSTVRGIVNEFKNNPRINKTELAKKYNVNRSSVYMITNGHVWIKALSEK